MNAALTAVQTRREILVAECAAERALLAEAWRGLQKPAAAGKRAAHVLSSPWLWAGVGLVALKLRKKNALRIPLMIWKGWRMVRQVRTILG
ncbi:MAG TPA: hypothetical protein VI282_11255 [Verrucomicrobiae bacterium]|jgi:hypothetical protein